MNNSICYDVIQLLRQENIAVVAAVTAATAAPCERTLRNTQPPLCKNTIFKSYLQLRERPPLGPIIVFPLRWFDVVLLPG